MRFAPEGIPFILGSLLLAAAAWAVSVLAPGTGILVQVLAGVLTVLTLFCLWFFRDPRRPIPSEPGLVLAPGEGHVIIVGEADEPTYLKGRCRKITIFLSVFDVHVQRAPVSGMVEYRAYKPGKYAVAWLEKASDDNEQAALGIATPHGKVLVKQIAGLVARRIVTDPSEGDTVERGHRIGLIRFGSRVDMFLPLEWEVTCKVGDRARVGVTVLARQPTEVGA